MKATQDDKRVKVPASKHQQIRADKKKMTYRALMAKWGLSETRLVQICRGMV